MGFPGGLDGKESACYIGHPGLIPESGRSPWRREWLPTPAFFFFFVSYLFLIER